MLSYWRLRAYLYWYLDDIGMSLVTVAVTVPSYPINPTRELSSVVKGSLSIRFGAQNQS